MRISTINAPYCVRLFPSDDSRVAVTGDGLIGSCPSQSTIHKIGTSHLMDEDVLFVLIAKFEKRFQYERRDEFGLLIQQQHGNNVTSFQNHLIALPS